MQSTRASVRPLRQRVAAGVYMLGIDRLMAGSQRIIWNHKLIRAVNYHGTPERTRENLERHFRFFARHYTSVSLSLLDTFFASGRWPETRPGLIISFDDGLRTNYDVAAPLLEEYGLVGWFMIPTGFVEASNAEQEQFATKNRIQFEKGTSPRIAMSWDEVRNLVERGHVVGNHTHSHYRMQGDTSTEALADEIAHAADLLQRHASVAPDVFCWVGGEESFYTADAARFVRSHGYRYGFMTCGGPILPSQDPAQIHRVNMDAEWPLRIVRFQLSGAIDLFHWRKRRRVNRATAPPASE